MLQPFKFITVIMKDRTNKGMQESEDGKPNMKPLIMLKDDMRYHPITLNDDGTGALFTTENRTKASIGILMESFNKTNAQHKVLIHGIVPMKALSSVKAGMIVYWDVAQSEVTNIKGATGSETPFIGRAMTTPQQDGDLIDVLLL